VFVFFHIPKAAGSSIAQAIHKVFPPQNCLKVRALQAGGDILPKDMPSLEIPDLLERPCCMGHFGLNSFRKNVMLMRRFERESGIALAVVRDPVDRLISDYKYINRTKGHPRKEGVRDASVVEYINRHAQNEQVKWLNLELLDGTWRSISLDCLGRRLIIVEAGMVDVIVPKLFKILWGVTVEVGRKNVAVGKEADDSLSAADRLTANERNQMDIEFVEHLSRGSGFWLGRDLEYLERLMLE